MPSRSHCPADVLYPVADSTLLVPDIGDHEVRQLFYNAGRHPIRGVSSLVDQVFIRAIGTNHPDAHFICYVFISDLITIRRPCRICSCVSTYLHLATPISVHGPDAPIS